MNYSIPMSSIVAYAVGIVVILAVIIAGVVLLRNRVRNWVYPIFVGAIFYMVFCYVLPELVIWILTMIPATQAWALVKPLEDLPVYEYSQGLKYVYVGLIAVLSFLGIWLGMKYLIRSQQKKQVFPVAGQALAFGLGVFVAMSLVGNVTAFFYHTFDSIWSSYTPIVYYQSIFNSNLINQNGFADTIASYVEFMKGNMGSEELTAAELAALETYSVQMFMQYVNNSIWTILTELLAIVSRGFAFAAGAVLVYGTETRQAKKTYMIGAAGYVVLYFAPYLVQQSVGVPTVVCAIYYALLTAAAVVGALLFMKHEMPGEMMSFSYSRKAEQKKAEKEKKKMPTIVMPKD